MKMHLTWTNDFLLSRMFAIQNSRCMSNTNMKILNNIERTENFKIWNTFNKLFKIFVLPGIDRNS